MTTKLKQAARQALEALREYRDTQMISAPRKAIEALREALAEQAEQRIPSHVHIIKQMEIIPEQDQVHVENIYKRGNKYFAWIGGDYVQIYTASVRTKDLTEPLIDELRECRDLLMCVESCSRNNFENLAYERVQAIDAVIAADRKLNGVEK